MTLNIAENIWVFPIALPGNPLKWLNCYVIKDREGGRDLIIDGGFNQPACLSDLLSGMEELGLRPENTDVFFTHAHADHTGNAAALRKMGCRLMMGRIDYEYMRSAPWERGLRHKGEEGVPEKMLQEINSKSAGDWLMSAPFEAALLEEGDCLKYGGHKLRCILTPGHTPGHLCLYDKEHRLMFSGDHVLFDITPNIAAADFEDDILGSYMDSLLKIQLYPVELTLPAHRTTGEISFSRRVDELYRHHLERLSEAERIVSENPGISCYDLAGHMSWAIRADSWENFPVGQKWFATGEALAHLIYLVRRGRVERRIDASGVARYRKLC